MNKKKKKKKMSNHYHAIRKNFNVNYNSYKGVLHSTCVFPRHSEISTHELRISQSFSYSYIIQTVLYVLTLHPLSNLHE